MQRIPSLSRAGPQDIPKVNRPSLLVNHPVCVEPQAARPTPHSLWPDVGPSEAAGVSQAGPATSQRANPAAGLRAMFGRIRRLRKGGAAGAGARARARASAAADAHRQSQQLPPLDLRFGRDLFGVSGGKCGGDFATGCVEGRWGWLGERGD